jgi:methyl-accepting chemotaxis protein
MRKITGPLQQIAEDARIISEGDLSRILQVRSRDEIGLVAETINGLTSDIQEIVALGLSTQTSLRLSLAKLPRNLWNDPECNKTLDEIDAQIENFREIAQSFTLLPAPSTVKEEKKQ